MEVTHGRRMGVGRLQRRATRLNQVVGPLAMDHMEEPRLLVVVVGVRL